MNSEKTEGVLKRFSEVGIIPVVVLDDAANGRTAYMQFPGHAFPVGANHGCGGVNPPFK